MLLFAEFVYFSSVLLCRGGFTVKLIKLKLQVPHLYGPLLRPWELMQIILNYQ
jgi:hypothetical protein